jgi:hypothetical protein
MKPLLVKLWRRQEGVALLMVLGFMALSIPIVIGYLTLAGTLITDSEVKHRILVNQYASQGCSQYAAWKLINEPGYADSLAFGDNILLFEDCNITINKPELIVVAQQAAFADLVIALDVGESLVADELVDLKQAANDIVDRFSLETTEGRVRIGMTRFADVSTPLADVTDVDEHPDLVPLHDAINGLTLNPSASDTNLANALNGAAEQFDTGLGDRVDDPPVDNIIVVITDGNDSTGNGIDQIIAASTATGAVVFAIGVGNEISNGTLNAISTQPASEHSLRSTNYEDLNDIIDEIVAAIYSKTSMGTLFIITSVGSDGTVVVSQVLLPPS